MTEIRTIETHEADEFLTLLCDVFALDGARARSIFFNEPLFDLRRKWALFEQGKLVSILTTVPLEFGWGKAVGIAGVATRPERRGQGFASLLMNHVLSKASEGGEGAALLFARETPLYERAGFRVCDRVLRGSFPACEPIESEELSFEFVRNAYAAWSQERPERLRRDESRWSYWKWNLRTCHSVPGGYLCLEGTVVRECVLSDGSWGWPLGIGREWYGLSTMAERLRTPLVDPKPELYLMGWNAPAVPEMFMTDQF